MSNFLHDTPELSPPRIERVRHELRRRVLSVTSVVDLTPGMRRVTLTGEALSDFVSLAPDDHVKIIVPTADGGEERRDYTPRRYDNAARSLVVDFALHEAGPVTQWAVDARPGDELQIGGPRGSAVIAPVRRWLLVGDETALPAMGRRIEESGAGIHIDAVAVVAGKEEEQRFETEAALAMRWAHRPLSRATDAQPLIDRLEKLEIQPGTFAWVAAEASVVRAVRNYLINERGLPLGWLKASGYWVSGKADTTEKFEE